MTSQDIPIIIKNNSEEFQDYLKDLKNWEKDIRIEDLKLIENKSSNSKEIPPIRSRRAKDKSAEMKKKIIVQKEKMVKSSRISSFDYDAWEKFDVDKALESGSEEEDSSEEENSSISEQNSQNNEINDNSQSDSRKERAERLKEEGNLCYAQGKLTDAIAKYTQGIGLNPSNALLPANRAMTYIKLKKFKAAENDCSKALNLDPNYIKAYLRRATARVHLSNIPGAIKDYEKVLKLEPWNKDAKRELEKLTQKSLNSDIIPPLEDATPSVNQSNHIKKKMKIEEIESNKSKVETSTQVPPISKPIHLQSTKALIRVPVVEVSSREKLKDFLNETKENEEQKQQQNVLPKKTSVEIIELQKPVLPKPPRTSHQFSQDWLKVNKDNELSSFYLKSIPVSFFNGIEIETDLLFEIINELVGDNFDAERAGSLMTALMTTRGFFLNIAFLDEEQKKGLERVLQKLETCDSFKKNIQKIQECL